MNPRADELNRIRMGMAPAVTQNIVEGLGGVAIPEGLAGVANPVRSDRPRFATSTAARAIQLV